MVLLPWDHVPVMGRRNALLKASAVPVLQLASAAPMPSPVLSLSSVPLITVVNPVNIAPPQKRNCRSSLRWIYSTSEWSKAPLRDSVLSAYHIPRNFPWLWKRV